jgi:hypothetical protein
VECTYCTIIVCRDNNIKMNLIETRYWSVSCMLLALCEQNFTFKVKDYNILIKLPSGVSEA